MRLSEKCARFLTVPSEGTQEIIQEAYRHDALLLLTLSVEA